MRQFFNLGCVKKPQQEKMGAQHPMEKANIFSKLVYFWLLPLIRKGHKENLTADDIYCCPGRDKVTVLKERLLKNWRKQLEEKKIKKPSLVKAVLRTFGISWVVSVLIVLFKECVVQLALAYCLGLLVKEDNLFSLTVIPGILSGLLLIYQACHHVYIFRLQRLGMDVRISCSALVYDKSLHLSQASLRHTTAGQIVNLLSNDVTRFDMGLGMIPYLLVAPLQVILICILLYFRYNPYLAVGFLVVIPLFVLLQTRMANLFARFRLRTAQLTDERIRLMDEVVTGMKVIKMYAWEKFFASHVDQARKNELKEIRKTSFMKGINSSMFFVASKILLFVSLLSGALLTKGAITPESVFVLMTLANSVRLTTTLFFPMGISFGAESLAALRRLQVFLELEEQEENKLVSISSIRPKPDQCGVKFSEVSCHWHKASLVPTLQNVSLSLGHNELMIVVGAVGAGKSSLLLSLLGELPVTKGRVEIKGKVAYSSQEPWLFAGTLRQNILFGRPFDAVRYKHVVHVSSLEKDLEILPLGDKTMVGERGVSLSGGQKARVNLARALYQDADIYLLDDPLSAVDANVSKHIFEKCITGFLKKKARILCTHQVQFLSQADKIIIIKDGQIQDAGTYKELVQRGADFGIPADSKPSSTTLSESESSEKESKEATSESGGGGEMPMPVTSEEMATGSISSKVYFGYLKAGSNFFWQIVLLLTYLGSQFLFNGSDYYLMIWSNYEAQPQPNKTDSQQKFIRIYMILVAGLFVSSLLRNFGFYTLCLRASRRLHADLAQRLFRAPMAFFDTNPIGNILNRCSRDMGVIDDLLPQTASECIEIMFAITGILVVISVIRWYLLPPALAIIIIFVLMRQFFLGASRDIKRLEGGSRGPVLSHVATSLNGLASLRAYGAQKDFLQTYAELQDNHTAAWFLYVTSSEWFGVAVDLMCLVYITLVTVTMGITAEGPGGDIGLAIASALGLCGEFMWGARQSVEVECHMTSVERVLQYRNLAEEASPDSENPPSPGWPSKGAISFRNVCLKYTPDGPLVLDNINWEIKPGEKVGIVGRTGAGKSSILSALLRLAEPSSGEVIIDGIRTSDLGLRDLRRAVAIIPQDPVLFTGTVRQNLDPLGEHQDSDLWNALEEVHLKASLTGPGLDAPLSTGSLSLGQRQLLCLARAVLRGSRILVLDEATASVDPDTDALIQETIRERFTEQTVLAIAHRLHTVMGYDRVLVMEAGKVREYGPPSELIDRPNGLLNAMVKSTGHGTAKQLREMAYHREITRL